MDPLGQVSTKTSVRSHSTKLVMSQCLKGFAAGTASTLRCQAAARGLKRLSMGPRGGTPSQPEARSLSIERDWHQARAHQARALGGSKIWIHLRFL